MLGHWLVLHHPANRLGVYKYSMWPPKSTRIMYLDLAVITPPLQILEATPLKLQIEVMSIG